jgi:transcriptional regulator with XRE-family HTH domain
MAVVTARRLVAENLRVLRLLRGWSQELLADMAGIDRSYIGEIERAERNISLEHLERLARAFEITIPDLLRAPDPKEVGTRLLANIRRELERERKGERKEVPAKRRHH